MRVCCADGVEHGIQLREGGGLLVIDCTEAEVNFQAQGPPRYAAGNWASHACR